ncbi:MAG: MFS transporter [Solirubrobacteraceae bacterium]
MGARPHAATGVRTAARVIRCLRRRLYRRLLAAYVFNELAWYVGTLALAVLVYRRTGSALETAVYFVGSQVVPALLAPPMVVRFERWDPRRALTALYLVEAVLYGALAYITRHFAYVPVLVVTIVDGIVAAAGRSLSSAARTEELKSAGLLKEGNTLASFLGWAAYMAGPVIGGLVVAAGGTVAALLANTGLFAAMGLILAITAIPRVEVEAQSVLGRLRDGIARTRADPILGRLLATQGLGLVVFTITVPIEVVYTQHTLHAGPGGYGVLMACWGAGCVIGTLTYSRSRHRSAASLISGASLALAAGFLVMAVAPSLPLALVGAVIGGAGNSVEFVAARTALQERASSEWMAILMGFWESVSLLAPGLGYMIGGVLTALTATRVAFAAGAGGTLVFAIAVPFVLGSVALRAGERDAADSGAGTATGKPVA